MYVKIWGMILMMKIEVELVISLDMPIKMRSGLDKM